jgi:outer membrane protein TolC
MRNRNQYTNHNKLSVKGIFLHNKFLFISIYFNLFLSISLFSQTDSLKSYLEIAAKNNPTVLQKFSEYKASLQKIPQAGALPDPNLTAGVLVQRMMLVMGYQIADIKLMQMFPWFGTLKYAKDEMSLMAKANYETYLEARYQVFFDVKSTWYELYRLKQDLRISQRNLDILKTIERLTLVRFRTAEGSAASGSGSVSGAAGSESNMQPQSSGT